MDTLYNLLGALPNDDAEGLRTAFRKAVKGTHPDLRPDDPEAAVKFRQIVRANEILLDRDQRAVYDHLLALALVEKDPAAAHPIAATIHKVASGVLAFASVSIVSVVGYLLFMHMSVALVAPTGSLAASYASGLDLTQRLSASIAAVTSTDAPNPAAVNAFIAARGDSTTVGAATARTIAAATTSDAGNASASDYANVVHASTASGDAVADPEQVAQLGPKFTAPYADRGILFFREKKDEHGFPDLVPLKRAEKPGHLAAAGKGHVEPLPKTVPLPVPRSAPRFIRPPPLQPWVVSASGS